MSDRGLMLYEVKVAAAGTEEDNEDQGLEVPEKLLDVSSVTCQKLGLKLTGGFVSLDARGFEFDGPTPSVTLGLLFFMKNAPMSSKSVSILMGSELSSAKVGWKLELVET